MDIETKNDIENWIRFHKCDTGIEARRAYSIVKALIDEVERLKAALKPKKYEYSIKNPNGNIMKAHEDEMFQIMPLICKVVRREVGEWEEVPGRDGE